MTTFLKKVLAAWRAARSRDELYRLSDRTLRDIGVNRAEIDSLYR